MFIRSPGASLPAAVTRPTAWAAFRDVFASSSWTVVLSSDGTDEVDLVYGPEFQGWLDEVSSRWYDAAARGFVSSLILEICGTLTPARVRMLRLVRDRDAVTISERLKSYVKEQVRAQLTLRFDLRAWEDRIRGRIELLPEPNRTDCRRYLGLDVLLPPKGCNQAVSYLFKTIKPEICVTNGRLHFASTWRTEIVLRKERSGDAKDLQRSLGLRAGEALLQLMPPECVKPGSASVEVLETKFRELVQRHGGWAIVALLIADERARLDLKMPEIEDAELQRLIDQQPVLLAEVLQDFHQQRLAEEEKDLARLLSGPLCEAA
jgi:hypothetical protein